ncbi:Thioredoxin-like_fold domain-containing protein (Fragment) [Durusdinium trenchii]|uniref:ubiquitinyl hydrolase 1 n=1 Tax=Durusdinium trenchii TaxID=1381693 RepID=A0ABP0HEB4_9DINO
METIAFISSVTLDSLPVPREGADDFWSSDLGADERSAEAQKKGLKALLDLASLYAFCWQSLERAQRAEDSERLLAVSQMLCVFDALLRRPVPNGTLLAELLKEDGGMSFHLGLCGDLRPLTQVLQRVELLEPRWLQKRREILAYFTARESATRHRIFDFRMVGSGTFEVRKYSSTMALLRKVLERKGLELIPRDGPPVSEMEALMESRGPSALGPEFQSLADFRMADEEDEDVDARDFTEWLFGRGQLWEACPEMYWCRDMAMLFKFLGTMEPRSTELLRKRRDTNEFWRLTFDGDMASRPGFGWRQDVPAIHWEVQGVRGADQDIADLTANAFGRELTLGEGLVVQSPADVGKLLERPNCTEEDVLHAARLPTFEETLSPDEAEALMSFLTVPYLQLPLVLDFFASQDRAAYLFNPEHLGQQGAGR